MVLALQILCFKMWLWILVGLSIITKAHGYASGYFPEVCQSMSPDHSPFAAQWSEPPFEVTYKLGKSGEPITVILQSKTATQFEGFMLEARVTGMVEESPPVGTFILLDTDATQLLTCGHQEGSAVSQRFNHRKSEIKVNWTAPAEELNITFRATFVQDYTTFWERVDEDVILPPTTTAPPPTTAASTTEPTTAASTTEPTTATTTTEPTTAASTMEPTTATTTTEPTTAASTTEPTTAASTTDPTTAASTTEPTTATSTTEPTTTTTRRGPTTAASTTEPTTTTTTTEPTTATTTAEPTTATSTTEPTTAASTTKTNSWPGYIASTTKAAKLQQAGTALMAFDILFVGLKTAQAHIVTTTLTNSLHSRRLITVSKIPPSLLCAAVEISSLMLLAVAQVFNVTLVALVCAVLLINFIKVVIDSVSVILSHELKEICNVAVKVCSVIHLILSTANVFIGVLEIVDCRETKNQRTESWLLKVMIAYTVWILLLVILVIVFSVHNHATMGRSKTGSSRQNERWSQQREKRTLSAAAKIATTVSVILIVGNVPFTAAVIGGIFSGKQSCA